MITQAADVSGVFVYFFGCSFDYFSNYAISAKLGAIVRL